MRFKKLVLASHNEGKIAELRSMLAPLGVELQSANDLDLPEVVEDQDTFRGNAAKKAEEIAAATGLPSLADDSGLCVDALDGGPGVETARYSRTYERLIDDIKNVSQENRGAQFYCVLALAVPNEDTRFFEGITEGFITTKPRGEGGFGYDPVFLPKGEQKTFAEMPTGKKHDLSHRGKALRAFLSALKKDVTAA